MALPKRGIDISEFNGSVDIAALQGQVDFVIIRCGYGSDYANQDDPQFEANVKKCQAAGIPWGTYLYSYAKTKAMAQSEAAHTLRLLQPVILRFLWIGDHRFRTQHRINAFRRHLGPGQENRHYGNHHKRHDNLHRIR